MNFLHDQKDMWLFPLELGKGRHWLPALAITGGTAVFIATDAQTMPHFRHTTAFHGFNRVFSTTATGAAMAVVPAVFYGVSLLRHDSYDQGSALFAGEAVADDAILMVVMKAITRRAPHGVPGYGTLQRHPFSQPFVFLWQRHELPLRPRHDGLLGSYRFRTTLSRTSLGSVSGLCRR